MDKPGGNEAGKVLKKGKKKHAKDELDRQKQAEKKRRRLEKALANSAAIISALEKKRQQKKEQEKQDEEGAAIAEAVALHVLIGDDSDDHLIMNKHRRCNRWDDVVGLEITPVLQGMDSYSSSRLAYAAHARVPQWRWADWGISGPFSSRGHMMDYQAPCHQRTCPPSNGCPGFIAAQAVSSLQIGDHSSEETFPQTDGFHGFIAAQAASSLQIGDHSYEDTFPHADGCPGFTGAHAVSSLQIGGHTSEDVFPIQGGGGTAVLHRILNNANNRLNLYKEL